MGDIIACLVGMPDEQLRKKIAETLRIHQIQTTENIQQATIIVHIPTEAPQMTIEEIALQLIEQTRAEIFELKEQFDMSDIPVVLPTPVTQPNKRKNFDVKHTQQQYSKTKQQQKQIFFNRTKHK